MKCGNCGFEFDDGLFCPECGTKYGDKIVDIPETPIADCVENSDEIDTIEKSEPIEFEEITNVINKEENKPKTQSTMGIVSFILGIVSFLLLGLILIPEIVGIILGIKGKKDKEHKTGLAKAGLVINIIVLAFWVLLYVLLIVLPSSETKNTTTEQVIEENVEVLPESENITNEEVNAPEVQEKSEKKEDSIDSYENKQDTLSGYTHDDICNMCSEYYAKAYNKELPYAQVDRIEGNKVYVYLWENIDDMNAGMDNWMACYSIDANTLMGYGDNNEKIDLSEIAATYNGNSRIENVKKNKEAYSDLFAEIGLWQPLDEYDKHILSAVGSYRNQADDNIYIAIGKDDEALDSMKVFFGDSSITDRTVDLVTDTGRVYYISKGKYGIIGGQEWMTAEDRLQFPSYAATFEIKDGEIQNLKFLQSDVDLYRLEGTYVLQDEYYNSDLCYTNVFIQNSTKKEIRVSKANEKANGGTSIKKENGLWTAALGLPGDYVFYIYDGKGEKLITEVKVSIDTEEIYGSIGYEITKSTFGGYKAKKYSDKEIKKIREEDDMDYGEAALVGSTLIPIYPRTDSSKSEYLDDYKISYMNLLTGEGNLEKEEQIRQEAEDNIKMADYEIAFVLDEEVLDDSIIMYLYFDDVPIDGAELVPGRCITVTDTVADGKHNMYWISDTGEKSNNISVEIDEMLPNQYGYRIKQKTNGEIMFYIDDELEHAVRNGLLH